MAQPQKTWRLLAEQASKETDSSKMISLVEELIRCFDEEKRATSSAQRRDAPRTFSASNPTDQASND